MFFYENVTVRRDLIGSEVCEGSRLGCVGIPTQPFLHMVQHVADWVAPFSRSQHSPPPPLKKYFHTPPSRPPLLPFLTSTRVKDNHHYHSLPKDWRLWASWDPIMGPLKPLLHNDTGTEGFKGSTIGQPMYIFPVALLKN